jgi:hypothetical protein
VRFLPPNDWWTYVYAWDKNDNKLLGNWPGTKIDPNANGWVEHTFAAGKNPVNVIFHNNVGAQSHDIVLEEDACYIWDSSLNDAVLTNECNVIDTGSSAPVDPEQGNTPKLLLDETLTLSVPQDDNNLYDMDSKNITHLYLTPGVWNVDGAWFAAYFFEGSNNTWKKMTAVEGIDGLYVCEIPSGYTNVIFARRDPSNTNLDWNKVWNQTADLKLPTDGTNKFAISGWENNGSWSTVYDNSKWTTFTEPIYTVTINITGYGSIEIDGVPYTNDSEDKVDDARSPIHVKYSVDKRRNVTYNCDDTDNDKRPLDKEGDVKNTGKQDEKCAQKHADDQRHDDRCENVFFSRHNKISFLFIF